MEKDRKDLQQIINKLYDKPLENTEVKKACDNLIGFFEILIDIDKEVSKKNDWYYCNDYSC